LPRMLSSRRSRSRCKKTLVLCFYLTIQEPAFSFTLFI
jgi:hypothetical protein